MYQQKRLIGVQFQENIFVGICPSLEFDLSMFGIVLSNVSLSNTLNMRDDPERISLTRKIILLQFLRR